MENNFSETHNHGMKKHYFDFVSLPHGRFLTGKISAVSFCITLNYRRPWDWDHIGIKKRTNHAIHYWKGNLSGSQKNC